MILRDTRGLLAALDSAQPDHAAAAAALAADPGPFPLSPFVLAELDCLLGARVGAHAQRALLDEVARGAFRLEAFSAADVGAALSVIERYADQAIGLADASIVVLAGRLNERRVLTLDHRHFRTILGPRDEPFQLLPADA